VAVAAAVASGALGARMTGGGFGGSAIALAERAARDDIAARLRATFRGQGFAEPNVFTVTPSDGAHRDA